MDELIWFLSIWWNLDDTYVAHPLIQNPNNFLHFGIY